MDISNDRQQIKAEWQLVLMGSVELQSEGEKKLFEMLMREDLDWSEVFYQLATHRIMNMFYHNVVQCELTGLIEGELIRMFRLQWSLVAEMNCVYKQYIKNIVMQFSKNGFKAAILKGNMLAYEVYPNPSARPFSDVDLLISISDASKITSILEQAGYVQGHYDQEKHCIAAASKKEKRLQQMTTHELVEFHITTDHPIVRAIHVDVNHNLLWTTGCPYKVDSQDLLDRAVSIGQFGQGGFMLDTIDNIIQLSCHLFKEACLSLWITDLRDLKIYKFADIFLYVNKYMEKIDWNKLINRVKAYGIEKIIYYNFHYIEYMYGKLIPDFVMDELRPTDLTFLNEYSIENDTSSVWEIDFFTRLFNNSRIKYVSEEQKFKMNEFFEAKKNAGGVMKHMSLETR